MLEYILQVSFPINALQLYILHTLPLSVFYSFSSKFGYCSLLTGLNRGISLCVSILARAYVYFSVLSSFDLCAFGAFFS